MLAVWMRAEKDSDILIDHRTTLSQLFGLHQVFQTFGYRGRHDHVAFFDIGQKVGAIHDVAKAGVPSVEQIFARRCQIGIKEQPKELRATRVDFVLFSGPTHGTVTTKGQHSRLSTAPFAIDS